MEVPPMQYMPCERGALRGPLARGAERIGRTEISEAPHSCG